MATFVDPDSGEELVLLCRRGERHDNPPLEASHDDELEVLLGLSASARAVPRVLQEGVGVGLSGPTPMPLSCITADPLSSLTVTAIPPREGYWNLPAGYMEKGESVAAAAAREAQEEALADIKVREGGRRPGLAGVGFLVGGAPGAWRELSLGLGSGVAARLSGAKGALRTWQARQ